MEEKKIRINLIAVFVPTLIMLVMFLYYLDVRSRAGQYDGVLISALFYMSIIVYALIIFEEFKKSQSSEQKKKEPMFSPKQAFVTLAIILFIPIQMLLGFVVSTFLFTLVVQIKLGVKKWSTRILVSSLMGIGLWFCFSVLLNVKLPLGVFKLLGVF